MRKFLLVAILFAGCASQHDIAQRKLKSALKHDPNIIAMQVTDTTIHTTVIGIDTIKSKIVETKGFNCDSILNELWAMKKSYVKMNDDIAQPQLDIYSDSTTEIAAKLDSNGNISIKYIIKQHYDTIRIPFKFYVQMPGKVATVEVPKNCYKYGWFWVLVLLCCGFVFIIVKSFLNEKSNRSV